MSLNGYKDGQKQYELDAFPAIKANVLKLDAAGLLRFVDINPWFTADDFALSPVGHYDTRWNYVLGENLARYIEENF